MTKKFLFDNRFRIIIILILISAICVILFTWKPKTEIYTNDWPMWRYDYGRSASSPEELPNELHLLWSMKFDQREMVWDDPLNNDLMHFDRVFEPIISGDLMFLGFNDNDKVAAINTTTGKKKWEFYTDGPVRLPVAAWEGKIYFTSDDGYLYCLSADKGKLLWKTKENYCKLLMLRFRI